MTRDADIARIAAVLPNGIAAGGVVLDLSGPYRGLFAARLYDAGLRPSAEPLDAEPIAAVMQRRDRAAVYEAFKEVATRELQSGDGQVQEAIGWLQAAYALVPTSVLVRPSAEPAGLAKAWRAVEAVLPEGWLTLTLSKRAKSDIGPYSAAVHDGSEGAMTIQSGLAVGHGSTPEVALQRLAARLAHDGEGTP